MTHSVSRKLAHLLAFVGASVVGLTLATATVAQAQAVEAQDQDASSVSAEGAEGAESDADAARRLFSQGMEELGAGRHTEAAAHFRASLDRVPRAATAFNLGLALRDAGANRQAMIVAEALSRGDYGAVDPSRREEVARLRTEIAERLASLDVRLAGAERAVLRIDGQDEGVLVDGESVSTWLEPGPHELVAAVTDGPSVEERIDAEAGERLRMVLNVTAGTATVEGRADVGTDAEDGGSAWPWVLAGVGVLAVAAAVVAVVLLTSSGTGEPTVDPVYGRVETLRF